MLIDHDNRGNYRKINRIWK